eukprot:1150628-Pelagomonas_calceolata.AAC.1
MNRKAVAYNRWCGISFNQTARVPFCIPPCLFKDLDNQVTRRLSRFRLCAHCLKVESYKWLGGSNVSNVCDNCDCAEVQDKKHALFYYNCLEGQSTHESMPLDSTGLPQMEDARCVMIWTALILLSSDV